MGIEEIERCISSSASIHQWKYDVFVSFRGKDIRKTFAAHLFHALRQAGIYYFRDNEKLETGIFIEPKLLDAIRHSRVALVVFTTNYADSRWCLNELVEVLECNRRFRDHQGHVVLPIFYDVEPGDIRRQSGRFGDGFERCLATHTDDLLVQKWKDALKEAGNLSGWHLNNDANGDQSNFIEQIVGHLYRISPTRISPYFVKNAIGVDSFVEDVISLLEIGSEDDVRVVGIWGMKGIGKTTLAKVVCDRVFREFEGVSLLENVGDANQDTLLLLQKRLLHDVLKVQGLELFDLNSNINEIKTKLCRKRILLVLDNITKKDQIDYFGAGDREWFRNGSRIVITTRDEQLLEDLKVDNKYMLPGLTHKESLQLLSRHAFRKDHPQEGYGELSESLVHYTGGLPIALKRFGSFLSKKRKNQWHEILEKLVRDPHLDSVGLPLEPFSSVLPFQSLGPYGGHGGRPYDDKTYTDVRRITLVVTSVIESFYIEYDQNGSLVRSPIHGGPAEGKICTVKLDYPNEFLTSVSGYIRENEGPVVIQSLIFHSNRRTYGPFGNGRGRFFSFPPVAGKIIGFFGRCGIFVDSIGAYLLPISHSYPFEVVGPFGNCNYEDRWDDDKHIDVREIELVSGSAIESITVTYEQGCSFAHGIASGGGTTNKINLDWLIEYLTSVSGYITSDCGSTIIHSLTFQSNKRTYGPFGTETGRKFSFPATGGKIIGFYGSSGSHLESLGAYFEPISHLYPVEFIGPFGGQGGHRWDDGKFKGVKTIKMMLEDVVKCISFEYDDNGESLWSPTHGHSVNGDIHTVNLDYPREFLTSMSGYTRHDNSVIQSLTFESNIRRHGPFGKEEGSFFSCALTCNKIIGFHGRSGIQLDALGVYSEPVSDLHLLRSIGPFGGQGGSPWDDGESTGVRGIIVRAGVAIVSITVEYDKNGSVVLGPKRGEDGGHLAPEIKLDYPREYLTSFSGHSGIFCGHIVVRSLTFQSNERTFGPFGEEIGKYFSFPSTGKKIVGFHGRCGSWIDSLGAHFET
ncbi:jacalin-related lectin 4-like isoform X1 [Rhodamnia argentea]|uniref:Jacalin-related lectin 4-like isoform X1 n=1 Tax=Rhodamnia argentea TaxID=178133 RepID=A0ABM3GUZ8_9MYRT|nr:jacalin-related lectin 4-like isoform X1 [Rhodamnia argentea]